MATIFEAARDAQLNYVPGERVNAYTGDVREISASVLGGVCCCRGECKSHTGPCTMKGSITGSKGKMCKACSMSMSGKKMKAGGPGSGKH